MKKLIVVAAAIVALAFTSQAAAGGYAGSRYDKSECTYTKATDTLYCEARFTELTENVMQTLYVSDPTCASGTRVILRTGTLVTTFRGWAYFTGHVPLAKNEIAGDEDSFEFTWQSYTDTDLGCFV